MKRSSATPPVAAMIAVLCRLVASTAAVSDGAFASAMMARRRLQSDDDDVVPFAGIVVYPSTKDNVTWNGTAGGGLATSQADYVKNELETDGQITGERHGYQYHLWESKNKYFITQLHSIHRLNRDQSLRLNMVCANFEALRSSRYIKIRKVSLLYVV